jgi:hypothetical protein
MFLASTFCCHSTGISISISACAIGTSNDIEMPLTLTNELALLAKQAGGEQFLAELMSNRGVVYRRSGDVPSALRCYQEALEKATLLKDWLQKGERTYGPSLAREAIISWAPDGQRVAFQSMPPATEINPPDINVFDMRTGETRKIAHGYFPTWSPSGQWIAFSEVGGRCVIIHPDGTGKNLIAAIPQRFSR